MISATARTSIQGRARTVYSRDGETWYLDLKCTLRARIVEFL